MQAAKVNRPINVSHSNQIFFFSILMLILVVIGVYTVNAFKAYRATFLPAGTVMVSQSVLEAKYGLRVNLVAVTAAGGMVDVRMKITDGEKAKIFLKDPKNYPALFIGGKTLSVSEDTKAQGINFSNDANLFLLFSNDNNLVKSGAPVTIVFGDTALEPILSR